MKPEHLIGTARRLVEHSGTKRPREADLRRAVSTAYYAMFHCLCESAANLLIGGGTASRSDAAWRQAYRALNHGQARKACEQKEVIHSFPAALRDFADEFVQA
ncbi:MAG: hypothetical protein GDA52_07600 [Rhodobacteraceae bacterium]|nr:hypothetical protein [Paracoccaceae bacterium]